MTLARPRIVIADDSAVIRHLLASVLGADTEFEICGAAPNGRVAVDLVRSSSPDLLILDLEMPEMGGLEALSIIRREHPRLPVIVYSDLTERGGRLTLEAFSLGAADCVLKPAALDGIRAVKEDLLPRVRALCARRMGAPPAAACLRTPSPLRPAVLAIVASTGGPRAVQAVFEDLPRDLPAPILVVQPMPAMFTRLLAERLSAHSRFRVAEAEQGSPLEPGRAWVAPGGRHLTLARDGDRVVCDLDENPPVNSCRPSADLLLLSLAVTFGGASVAVVLTGLGRDGVEGCRAVRAAGGHVLVQDEATSVVWETPGAVAAAGLADDILPLPDLGSAIAARFTARPAKPLLAGDCAPSKARR